MRNLTIRRHKSFVGCLMAYQVYIEIGDPDAAELTIGGVPCRKLGTIKNGEEQVFSIEEGEARIFVIGDRLSKEFCNEFIRIPAGEEDVFLSGKSQMNPASGNAFRFDGVASEEMQMSRRKGISRGVLVLCIAAAVGFVIGFLPYLLIGREKPQVFKVREMTVTLTDRFERTETLEGQTAAYLSDSVGFVVVRDAFQDCEGLEFFTLPAYAALSKEANPQIDSELQL